MSGGGGVGVTVIIALGGMIVFFVVYYLGSISKTVFDIKIKNRQEMEEKFREVRGFFESEVAGQTLSIRKDVMERLGTVEEKTSANSAHLRSETLKALKRMSADIAALQQTIDALNVPAAISSPTDAHDKLNAAEKLAAKLDELSAAMPEDVTKLTAADPEDRMPPRSDKSSG